MGEPEPQMGRKGLQAGGQSPGHGDPRASAPAEYGCSQANRCHPDLSCLSTLSQQLRISCPQCKGLHQGLGMMVTRGTAPPSQRSQAKVRFSHQMRRHLIRDCKWRCASKQDMLPSEHVLNNLLQGGAVVSLVAQR